YAEFENFSSIKISTYKKFLNIKDGKYTYDKIVRYYVSDGLFEEYIINKNKRKNEAGRETGKLSAKYTLEDYEYEFHRVFSFCKSEYGDYPTLNMFEELCKYNLSSYRRRFNMSWMNLCSHFGYTDMDFTANRSEKLVLDIVSEIIDCEYEAQKSFEWLIGVNNYPLFCDGYYANKKLVVEFDGRQHYEPVDKFGGEKRFKITVENDSIKNTLIPKNGLKLVRIS